MPWHTLCHDTVSAHIQDQFLWLMMYGDNIALNDEVSWIRYARVWTQIEMKV